MPKLNAVQKRFIVMELAMFSTPTEVAVKVKEEYKLDLKRQAVQTYDPTSAAGKDLSKELRKLFEDTRKTFRKDIDSIPIANKAVRLRRLDRMAAAAETAGNRPLAAQLMEQAAKECGDAYTNVQKHRVSGALGSYELTDDDLDRELKALFGEGQSAPIGG